MLYGNDSISVYSKSNITIWMLLALQGGFLNMAGIMMGEEIVSHVTGIATQIGFNFALKDIRHTLYLCTLPLFFIMGGMVTGTHTDLRIKLQKRPKYYIILNIMAFCLSLIFLSYFIQFFKEDKVYHEYFIVTLLCFTCGMQNALVTIVSKSVVRTTHLTGTTTDLAIGLMRTLHRNVKSEVALSWIRVGLITFFIFGAILSAYLFRKIDFYALLYPISFTLGLSLLMVLTIKKSKKIQL